MGGRQGPAWEPLPLVACVLQRAPAGMRPRRPRCVQAHGSTTPSPHPVPNCSQAPTKRPWLPPRPGASAPPHTEWTRGSAHSSVHQEDLIRHSHGDGSSSALSSQVALTWQLPGPGCRPDGDGGDGGGGGGGWGGGGSRGRGASLAWQRRVQRAWGPASAPRPPRAGQSRRGCHRLSLGDSRFPAMICLVFEAATGGN